MPQPGKTPEKEYHSSYSRVQVNFECSVEDLSDMIMVTFKSDNELRNYLDLIEKEVRAGNQSMMVSKGLLIRVLCISAQSQDVHRS